jgi:hypothetical protein
MQTEVQINDANDDNARVFIRAEKYFASWFSVKKIILTVLFFFDAINKKYHSI